MEHTRTKNHCLIVNTHTLSDTDNKRNWRHVDLTSSRSYGQAIMSQEHQTIRENKHGNDILLLNKKPRGLHEFQCIEHRRQQSTTNLKKKSWPNHKTPRMGKLRPGPKLAMNLKMARQEHYQAEEAAGTKETPWITPETPWKLLTNSTRAKLRRLELCLRWSMRE